MEIELNYDLKDPRNGQPSRLRPHQQIYVDTVDKYDFCLFAGEASVGKTATNLWLDARTIVRCLMANIQGLRGGDPQAAPALIHVHKKLAWARGALTDPLHAILQREFKNPKPSNISKAWVQLWFTLTGDKDGNRERYGTRGNHVIVRTIGLDKTSVDPEEYQRSSENSDFANVSQGDILSEYVFTALYHRVGRLPLPAPLRGQQRWDANLCKNFLRRLFIQKMTGDIDPDRFYACTGTVEDMGEEILSQAFRDSMAQRSVAQKRSARDWDYAPGQAFGEYDDSKSFVLFDQIPFDSTLKLKESMDWGFRLDPAFWLWYQIDYDGNLWFLDEEEMYDHNGEQQAKVCLSHRERLMQEISAKTGNEYKDQRRCYAGSYGGTDLNQQESGIGKTRGDMIRDGGIDVQVVNPDNSGQWEREESKITHLAALMVVDPNRVHPITGKLGSPRLFISNRCERLREQIQNAMIDPDNPKRIDKNRPTNRFAEGRTHHWDGLDAAFIASQEAFKPRRYEKVIYEDPPPNWKRDTTIIELIRDKTGEKL